MRPGEASSTASKQVEAYAVKEGDAWVVITVIVKYFGQQVGT